MTKIKVGRGIYIEKNKEYCIIAREKGFEYTGTVAGRTDDTLVLINGTEVDLRKMLSQIMPYGIADKPKEFERLQIPLSDISEVFEKE